MTFTKLEIMDLKNPYEYLSSGDQLAKNLDELNALGTTDKVTLATKIIAACPSFNFKNYIHQIQALPHQIQSEETFYPVLFDAYQVRQSIFALLDQKNKNPHALFTKEFRPDLFHRFSDLAQLVLKGNEQAIAERLALRTPEEIRSQIARNADAAFPKSTLSTNIQLAFTLRQNIDKLLLGDQPEQFFTCCDYSKESCTLFLGMFRALLKGQEVQIAQKLSAINSVEVQTQVRRELALLHTEAFDETNPFKLIAAAISQKTLKDTPLTCDTTFFNRPSTPLSSEKNNVVDQFDDSEEEYDETLTNRV